VAWTIGVGLDTAKFEGAVGGVVSGAARNATICMIQAPDDSDAVAL
jgi:hypothetical protein